ncbi:hypothetical protein ACTXT7_011453 [Hymenolepis weldensis]
MKSVTNKYRGQWEGILELISSQSRLQFADAVDYQQPLMRTHEPEDPWSELNALIQLYGTESGQFGIMVTHNCVQMTEPASNESFSLKPYASLGCHSTGNRSSSMSSSKLNSSSNTSSSGSCTTATISSSDSGEKTLDSDSTSVYIYTRGQFHHHPKFFTSDEEEEDWSISENAASGVTHFTQKEPFYIPTYRLMTALDVWIQEIRGQTENESPSPMISKPLT